MTYVFETKLETWDDGLDISRKVQIPSAASLSDLGCLILAAYGAQGYHLFDFAIAKTIYGCDEECSDVSVFDISVQQAFGRAKNAVFSYDYGDGWTFSVKLVQKNAGDEAPKLLSGTGRGIIEDVGGVGGLEDFIYVFKKREGERYEELCDWLGIKQYNAKVCKVEKINKMLNEYASTMVAAYEGRLDEGTDILQFKKWFEECFGSRFWLDEDEDED